MPKYVSPEQRRLMYEQMLSNDAAMTRPIEQDPEPSAFQQAVHELPQDIAHAFAPASLRDNAELIGNVAREKFNALKGRASEILQQLKGSSSARSKPK